MVQLSDPAIFPIEGVTFRNIPFGNIQAMARRLFRIIGHVHYKHWGCMVNYRRPTSVGEKKLGWDTSSSGLMPAILKKEARTPKEQLAYAASVGSILEVKGMLKAHEFEPEELPLIEACKQGHTDIVSLLLEIGADVDNDAESDSPVSYEYPLLVAARHGHRDVVLALLCHGPTLDVTDKSGRTPLFWACR